MSLMSKFREKTMGAQRKGEYFKDHAIPTGFTLIDMANGCIDQENDCFEAGIRTGRTFAVCGFSGSGKSTLIAQLVFPMVQQFENGEVYWFDAEKAMNSKSRAIQLYCGNDKSPELLQRLDEQLRIENEDTYLDKLADFVKTTHDFKMQHLEELTEEITGYDGKKHQVLAPTIIVVDSLASTFSKASSSKAEDDGELSNKTAGAQQAIENNDFIAKSLNMLYSANIMIGFVSHLNTKPAMGTPEVSKIPFLPPNENVKGGSGSVFYADYSTKIFKGTILHAEKDYGFDGFINQIQILKSRSNVAGRKYPLVFDSTHGGIYDNLLSNVQFLYETGDIKSAGPYSVLNSMPSIKFTKKTVREVVAQHPELGDAIEAKVVEIMTGKMYHCPIKSIDSTVSEEEAEKIRAEMGQKATPVPEEKTK